MTGPITSNSTRSLPTPRSRLIGREAERETAQSLLLDAAVPLLTFTGPGGVGKTRLAVAIGHDIARHFADGVFFIDLAPVSDKALVPAEIAATMKLELISDQSITDAIVGHALTKQHLLILDNCEHVLAVVADLVAEILISCPAVQVMATSRAPLQLREEQRLPVAPFPLPSEAAE